jgi:hypothetical protein
MKNTPDNSGFIDEYDKHKAPVSPTFQSITKDAYAFVIKDDSPETPAQTPTDAPKSNYINKAQIEEILGLGVFRANPKLANWRSVLVTEAGIEDLQRLFREAKETKTCRKCNAPCKPSTALHNPLCGSGEQGSTLAPSSEAHLINCLKCTICGHSFVVKE